MKRLYENKPFVSFLVAAATTVLVQYWLPFPKDNPVLELIGAERPRTLSGLQTDLCRALLHFALHRDLGHAFTGLHLPRPKKQRHPPWTPAPLCRTHRTRRALPRPRRSPPSQKARTGRASPLADDPPSGTLYRPGHFRCDRYGQDELLHGSLRRADPGLPGKRSRSAAERPGTRSQRGLLPQGERDPDATRPGRRLRRNEPRFRVSLQPASQRSRSLRPGLRDRVTC